MGAGSSGKGGSAGVPPVLPNQPISGKGGSTGIPPAQPNQPTLGNQLNPQPPTMGKGGAQPMGMGNTQADYDRMMAMIKFAPGAKIPTYEEWSASRMGKGGAQPQLPQMPQQPMGKGGAQPMPVMPVNPALTGKGGGIATLPNINPGKPAPRPAPRPVRRRK